VCDYEQEMLRHMRFITLILKIGICIMAAPIVLIVILICIGRLVS
jgi:hypothetical protein